MKIFYHNDSDGKCAGFWVYQNARLSDTEQTDEYIAMDYGKPFPFEIIEPNDQVYIAYALTCTE